MPESVPRDTLGEVEHPPMDLVSSIELPGSPLPSPFNYSPPIQLLCDQIGVPSQAPIMDSAFLGSSVV